MSNEPKAMQEIHEIRERLYEQQKDWTDEQKIAHCNKIGEQVAKELGLRIVPHVSRNQARAKNPSVNLTNQTSAHR